jgi:hypothetical protein
MQISTAIKFFSSGSFLLAMNRLFKSIFDFGLILDQDGQPILDENDDPIYNEANPATLLMPLSRVERNYLLPLGDPDQSSYASTTEQVMINNNDDFRVVKEGVFFADGARDVSSARFNGAEYLDYGNDTKLQVTDKLKINYTHGGGDTAISKYGNTSNSRGFALVVTSGKVQALLSSDGISITKNYITTTIPNIGDKITLSYINGDAGDDLKILFNDIQQPVNKPSDVAMTTIFNSTENLEIGRYNKSIYSTANTINVEIYDDATLVLDAPLTEDFEDKSASPATVTNNGVYLQAQSMSDVDSDGNTITDIKGLPPATTSTNLILASEEPANQSVTVVDATVYTLSVGEGSATATGYAGTATPGDPLTITTTSTTVPLVFTSAKYCNFELGDVATRWIWTSTTPVTRQATDEQLPANQINQSAGTIFANVEIRDKTGETELISTVLESDGGELVIQWNESTDQWTIKLGTTSYTYSDTLNYSEFQHLGIGYDNATDIMKFYRNGSLIGSEVAFDFDTWTDTYVQCGMNPSLVETVVHIKDIATLDFKQDDETIIRETQL